MLDLIRSIPEQLRYGWDVAVGIVGKISRKPPGRIVVCGMGGSGISGDLIRGLLVKTSAVPVEVIKDYSLPGWVGEDSFAVVVSYSGNTEETLSAWEELDTRSVPRMAITSGGKLEELAQNTDIPVVKIPGGNPPRASVGYLFAPLLHLVFHWGLYPGARDELWDTIDLIGSRISRWEQDARATATAIHHKFPIIHVLDSQFLPLGYRFNCQLNENSKILAHVHVYSELNHNEIMGFEGGVDQDIALISLNPGQRYTHPRNLKRASIVAGSIHSSISTCTIEAEGDSLLERFFSLLVKCDLISVLLADLRGVDPMPVNSIEDLKKELG